MEKITSYTKNDLEREAENRKSELNNALGLIGIEKEESKVELEIPETAKEDSFNEEEYNKFMDILNSEISRIESTKEEIKEDTEVIMHEPREDVINEIYLSEEVMEGQVFPYLNGLLGE